VIPGQSVLKLKVSDPIRLPWQILSAWRRRSSPIRSPGSSSLTAVTVI
jgi:hypothetical protein